MVLAFSIVSQHLVRYVNKSQELNARQAAWVMARLMANLKSVSIISIILGVLFVCLRFIIPHENMETSQLQVKGCKF